MHSLQGSVWYRERMLLPPEAEIIVRLEDVARMDVAAEQIAETRFPARGGPPYAFGLQYDPARITDRGRYALRARIEADGRLLFINTTHVPAFETAPDEPVEIMVSRVTGMPAEVSGPEPDLIATRWQLVELEGEQAPLGAVERDVYMILDESGRVSGFSGCNRFMGGFERNGDELRFLQLASTMMACPEGMDLEQRFLKALSLAAGYSIDDQSLVLVDEDGERIMRFDAQGEK